MREGKERCQVTSRVGGPLPRQWWQEPPSSLSRACLSLDFILEGVSFFQTIIFLPTGQNISFMKTKIKGKNQTKPSNPLLPLGC